MPIKISGVATLEETNVSNAYDTVLMPRHRWYYYKEGFSPRLVSKAIDGLSLKKTDLVIDPFNGSGTTGIMAYKLKRKYIGIDKEKEYLDLTIKRKESETIEKEI